MVRQKRDVLCERETEEKNFKDTIQKREQKTHKKPLNWISCQVLSKHYYCVGVGVGVGVCANLSPNITHQKSNPREGPAKKSKNVRINHRAFF